ncbi:MAG: hypothetical protein U0797_15685 [Gemmataceae bacterium]
MRRPFVWLLLGVAVCCLAALLPSRQGQGSPSATPPPTVPYEKHYVTPRQLTAAGSLADRRVERFATDRPTALLFLKQGCPCNDDFAPFWRRLQQAYGDRLAFVTVTDDDREAIRLFEVENSGYLILLRPDGTVDAAWPGWSREMFEQVHQRAAALAGVAAAPPDLDGLPHALTTGCPYEK